MQSRAPARACGGEGPPRLPRAAEGPTLTAREHGARVLVVEDNVKVAELLALVLEAEGYRVLRAYSGAEAIEVTRGAQWKATVRDDVGSRWNGGGTGDIILTLESADGLTLMSTTAWENSEYKYRWRFTGGRMSIEPYAPYYSTSKADHIAAAKERLLRDGFAAHQRSCQQRMDAAADSVATDSVLRAASGPAERCP